MKTKKATLLKQKQFLKQYVKSNGNIQKTCEALGMSRSTFYRWEKEDEDFMKMYEEEHRGQMDDKRDIGEDLLFEAAKKGNVQAIIHINKTLNRQRGYGEHIDVTSDSQPIQIIFGDMIKKKDKDI
tara:strand:- start:146 stop:523 length:378 start_codon:yes stop_codon:yes gene_type:complete